MSCSKRIFTHRKKYPRNDFSDRILYNEWEAEEEKKYYQPFKIEVEKQNVINNFAVAETICKNMITHINKYNDKKYINVGFDSEKEFSTMQTSICLYDYYKRDDNYE